MRRALWFAGLLAGLVASPAVAAPQFGGLASYSVSDLITEEQRAAIQSRLALQVKSLRTQGRLSFPASPQNVALGWPLAPLTPSDFDPHGISNFVDENPTFGAVLDYNCGTRTYDQTNYNHQGTDFFTWPFGFYKMDHDEVAIVAAADGVIIAKDDGNFDRNCGFGSGNWNAVYVMHADNSVAWYGHMKNGSLTSKFPGETVTRGERLGIVGSSGNSTGPHLHFELYSAANQLTDPWGGPCNSMGGVSWWADQRPYYDSAVNAVLTHSAPPNLPGCPNTEIPNTSDTFTPGQTVYYAVYYHDQLQGQVSQYKIYDANGALYDSWSDALGVPWYAADYWYWYAPLNTAGFALGQWRFEVTYQGKTYNHYFYVVDPVAAETPVPRLGLSRLGESPARGAVELEYRLPAAGLARVAVFDTRGRRVAGLVEGWKPAGAHRVTWNPGGAAGSRSGSGPAVYLAKLTFGDRSRTEKILVLP